MKRRYTVSFKKAKPANTIKRLIKPKVESIPQKTFDGKTTVAVEFLLINVDNSWSSVRMTCATSSSFMKNLAETAQKSSGSKKVKVFYPQQKRVPVSKKSSGVSPCHFFVLFFDDGV